MKKPTLELFLAKLEMSGCCWIRNASLDRHGYGGFHIDEKSVLAHRYSYEAFVGPIPEGLVIDHLCRNRACVNPDHLEAVTMAENNRRGKAPSILLHFSNKCKHGHELTPTNSYVWSGGRVYCRECNRQRVRAYKAKKRAHKLEVAA